jgi:hypothetical protein
MCPELPLPDSCNEPSDSDLEQDQQPSDRGPDVLDGLARTLFNPSQVHLVKLVYETNSRFHADMPARYTLMLPVALPHRLNPHIPAPPYYYDRDNITFHRNLHMAMLRPVLAGALHELLGSDAPVASVLGSDYEPVPEYETPTAANPIWMQFSGVFVDDRETGFNLETGYWRGRGREGYGIDAYFEYEGSDDVYVVQWIFYHINWRVGGEVDGGAYPPIVQLRAQAELEDARVVFHVSEHPEWSWKYTHLRSLEPSHLDDDLRRHLERMDTSADRTGTDQSRG